MLTLILTGLLFALRTRRALALENLALRHQLAVLQRAAPRPRLRRSDRLFFSEAACQEETFVRRISALALVLVCEDDGRACVGLAVRGLSSFSSRCQWRLARA